MSDSSATPTQLCPTCGYAFDRASSTMRDGVKPKDGDLTLCLSCGEVLFFTDGLKVRMPEDGELNDLDRRTAHMVNRARELILETKKSGNGVKPHKGSPN